ncbi:MAG: D-alanyl-D-alanine carboxypeptidase/D-alanyl-D-alanine-endopeptidase, partial [Proteiniphilum acetatigenes]
MQKNLIFFIFLLSASVGYSQTALQRFVNHPALKHASVGVSVVDMATGSPVVAYDADKSLTPASVLKLITTATALETLGENYRYKTDVALDADDPSRILVIGSG